MNVELITSTERRAALHAALGDVGRLRIVDALLLGDASPSELATTLPMPTNLLAHHLKVLESQGLITRQRSEGDRRRSYVQLSRDLLASLGLNPPKIAARVVFVCTANTARSHLAVALWRRASDVPATSAGTHPADRIDARTFAAANRYELSLRRVAPQGLDDVYNDDDLIVTVCDMAREELGPRADLHWSIPDPVRVGTDAAFDDAVELLGPRVEDLASSLIGG